MNTKIDFEALLKAVNPDDSHNVAPVLQACCSAVTGKRGSIASALCSLPPGDALATNRPSDSVWSAPRTTQQAMWICDRSWRTQAAYEKNADNFRRYVRELEVQNVLHRFGPRRNQSAYCIEPYVVSWSAFNEGHPYLLPASITRLLRSRSELFSLFWNLPDESKPYHLAELRDSFCEMLVDAVGRMHPTARVCMPEYGGRPSDYLRALETALDSLDPHLGFSDMKLLWRVFPPALLRECSHEMADFAEIIPKKGGLMGLGRSKFSGPGLKVAEAVERKTSAASGLPEEELDILGTPAHLLAYFERAVKRALGCAPDLNLFLNYQWELQAASELHDKMVDAKRHDKATLETFVFWFVSRKAEALDITSRTVGLRELGNAWEEFAELSVEVRAPTMNVDSDIYPEMSAIFEREVSKVTTEKACKRYGFYLTAAYLIVFRSTAVAKEQLLVLLSELRDTVADAAHAQRARRMMEATASLGAPDDLVKEVPEIIENVECLGKALGMQKQSPASATNERVRAFWGVLRSQLDPFGV